MTKRQLGLLLILLGSAAVVALLAIDWLQAGNYQGIGPVQRVALIGGGAAILVGLSLLPLGDRPA